MKTKLLLLFIALCFQNSFGQFVTTWQTLTDNKTITIPTNSAYSYNYNVDWGDGTTSANQTGDASHNYVLKGTYTVSITGMFPAIYVNYSDARPFLKTVEQWGDNPWKSMANAFEGCTYFRVLATDIPDLSNVTDMSYMFSGINANFDEDDDVWNIPNIENWDVSNVTNMSSVFNFMQGFNQDISSWDVSNVTDMSQMLRILKKFNQDISGWDVSKVTNMRFMFHSAYNFNRDISGWDVSNVTDMSNMFEGTNFNQDISSWDVSKVSDMSNMFEKTNSFNQDISVWDVSNVTKMNSMFEKASAFNQDIGNWNVSNVTDMSNMLNDSGLSFSNYDAILTGWAAQNVNPNLTLNAEGLTYCNAVSARTILTSAPNNWTITDAGTNCVLTTAIPDTNFEQALIDLNIDSDAIINGQVLKTDIENVTQLLINDKNIENLIGIQDFTSLVELNAANNQIENIDLSKNLLLEKLFIANNQLTEIEFSKNIELKNVDVGENSLLDLDVHQLIELETLSCYKNQLNKINLYSNKNLNVFIANENQLKNVDIRENKNLFWIDVDDNNLESLVVKNDNNTKITTFSATGNPNLTCIEVDDVGFSETNWTAKDATANFSTDCAPTNDDCSNAIPLVLGQKTPGDINSGTFTNATDCVAGTIIADVWYSITVPETGEFSIEGSGFGGLLKFAIYESCASTSSISCGLNISLDNLTPGVVYYLKVWMETSSGGNKSQVENGTFTLTSQDSSVLSVDDLTELKTQLIAYPNPANSFINIKTSTNIFINSIEVFNTIGKSVLFKDDIENKEISINTSNFSKGIYFIKANTMNSSILKKIIIE